jgi:hypothetical protein
LRTGVVGGRGDASGAAEEDETKAAAEGEWRRGLMGWKVVRGVVRQASGVRRREKVGYGDE